MTAASRDTAFRSDSSDSRDVTRALRDPFIRLVRVRVEDRSGVLQRVTNCLGRRGLRLLSCSVGQNADPGTLSLWLQVEHGSQPADQVAKQLAKLIDVVSVEDLTGSHPLEWVTALVEIRAEADDPATAELLESCNAEVVRRDERSLLAALSGTPEVVEAALERLRQLPLVDWILSRPIGLGSGDPLPADQSRNTPREWR